MPSCSPADCYFWANQGKEPEQYLVRKKIVASPQGLWTKNLQPHYQNELIINDNAHTESYFNTTPTQQTCWIWVISWICKTVFQRAEKLFSENAKLKDGERELFIKLGGLLFINFTMTLNKPTGEPNWQWWIWLLRVVRGFRFVYLFSSCH